MIHQLRAAGVGLVLDSRGAGVPAIVHWGRDLGPLAPADLVGLEPEMTVGSATPLLAPASALVLHITALAA
ncbi:hypothetical protein K0817_005335 [Microbacterium sp. HD4P20]|uniref:hypothetical protein n=1 Tax=Microbacterium sp. HD4P20 TaxID=2864874 RepID=UPI001C642760|nr:hypothetical protein [Microbacterium sp. HD4P20]MCP2635992.1 hypothetical protein [Microbacterium sp. HD4P20]